ncbi:wall-associated receptor kinase 2 [Dendrobium catenatum]|uniref:wall-associated receptor kinase 2 n=1 Tax=Dendrobium catenatum TaxID=906689 RepID=UPI0010A056E5|nr:wall-associated receptor kinase 2 [Dendrobium catenatum]
MAVTRKNEANILMRLTRSLPLPWLLFFLLLQTLVFSQPTTQTCSHFCGDVKIPYPFGLSPNCSLPGFQLSCNLRQPPLPPILSLPGTKLRILDISNGELRIDSSRFIASHCAGGQSTLPHLTLPRTSPFTFSGSSNRFIAIGCDTVAVISDGDGTFTSGCVSLCAGPESIVGATAAGECSGVGCCEAAVPYGRRHLSLAARSIFGYVNVSPFSNCSYSFLSENGGHQFKVEDLRDFNSRASISTRLDWAVGEGDGCSSAYLCGENGYCVPSPRGSGYLCNCLQGFKGNPYLNGSYGCQDVNECLNTDTSPCVPEARCQNLVSGYKCSCPFGRTGDGTKNRSGCRNIFPIVEAILGTALVIGVILVFGLWIYFASKQRSLIKLREQYFRQNGGLLLKHQISTREGFADNTRIFSSEELQRATAGYSDNRIIGTGSNGTVYKGILDDQVTVSVMKSRALERSQIDQFINEVFILSHINHRNVVRLLGCCLETKVPMLIFEFVANGTLYKQLHERDYGRRLQWKDRVRIAIETAEALAYLHSVASMSIFHRDINSSNILLDDNFTAKISDFGISTMVPMDHTKVPILVRGTFGYLDPDYFQTSQLTAKSGVYSFGVVLVELLTGEKPVSFERSKEDSNLAMYFLSSLNCKDLWEFIDVEVMREGNFEQVSAVAELARKCLLLRGEKQPTTKEVAQELALVAGCWKNEGNGEIEEEKVAR